MGFFLLIFLIFYKLYSAFSFPFRYLNLKAVFYFLSLYFIARFFAPRLSVYIIRQDASFFWGTVKNFFKNFSRDFSKFSNNAFSNLLKFPQSIKNPGFQSFFD